MYEVSEAAKVVTQSADPHAKVIFGAIIDEQMKDEIKITVIATGFDSRPLSQKPKVVLASGMYVPPARSSAPSSSMPSSEPLERVPFGAPRKAVSATPFQSSAPRDAAPLIPTPSSTPMPVERQPHVQPPQYAPVNAQRPVAPPIPTVPTKPPEEEEMEIPAFIRKKMM
jgi:hypothetical protein